MVSSGAPESSRESYLKLFVRDVREGKKRPFEVPTWFTIKEVKEVLSSKLHVPPHAIRLYYGPLLTSGKELPNHRTLQDAGIYRSGETLLLDIRNVYNSSPCAVQSSLDKPADILLSASMRATANKFLRSLVTRARRGLTLGLKPDLVMEGSGGSYFLHDARKNKIAVFKPSDEEPYAANNPRGYLPQDSHSMALREGVKPGEACIREVAAFQLDKGSFSGVPHTTLVEARHPAFNYNGAHLNVSQGGAALGAHSIMQSPVSSKLAKKPGSFQEFVRCECTIDDISPSMISTKEVHKIAILDIRIMNADRNAANLLVRRKRDNSLELVPIDHGYCLRSVCDVSWMDWCWLDWPQLKQPLCHAHKEYIKKLDIEADAKMLQENLNICEEAIDYFRASSALLKAGVAAGLTLYDIAVMCCRNDDLAEVPSMMEKLFGMASELANVAVANERYHHSTASRALVDQLSTNRRRTSWFPYATITSKEEYGNLFSRSVSSVDFASFAKEMSASGTSPPTSEELPLMAQSAASASDISSDAEDISDDNVDRWAEDLIAGLNVKSNLRPMARPSRSSSFCSDDMSSDGSHLSGTPRGFWVVRPGSEAAAAPLDDNSIQWSPKLSPRVSVEFSQVDELVSMWQLDHEHETGVNSKSVSFAEPSPTHPPVSTVDISEAKMGSLESTETAGIRRCKSYTALTAAHAKRTGFSIVSPSKFSGDYIQYKKYFHKFIDLVIVRETTTTAALHQGGK